jgi:hypothetical protein
MGIDRIGKHGPPAVTPPKEARESSAPSSTDHRPFDVHPTATATGVGASAQPQAQGVLSLRPALDRLRAGEIDANGYVDQKVDEAMAHLGRLPPGEIESIRSSLRDRIRSDPMLVDLVRTAAGQAPQSPRDD